MNIDNLRNDGFSYCDITLEKKVLNKMQLTVNDKIKNNNDIKLKNDNFIMINQPYLFEPFFKVATLDEILEIPFLFFEGREFFLGTCNLRRSMTTKTKDSTTTMYHRDQNLGSIDKTKNNFLKVFVYLTDVTETTGPFTYAKGSHKEMLENIKNYRVSDQEVKTLYPETETKLTGPAGTILVANTIGLHKGTKVQEKHRDMFTMNFSTVPEPGASKFFVNNHFLNELPLAKKKMCKYLKVV